MRDGPDIAVTGMGLVLATGVGAAAADAVFAGRSAVRNLNGAVDVVGATGAPASHFRPPPGTERRDRVNQMAIAAADQAWRQAHLEELRPDRVAVLVTLSKGAVFALARWAGQVPKGSERSGREADVAGADPGSAGRAIAARYGLSGPVVTPVTACASGGHAIAWAAGLIRRGVVDAAVVGAAEASLHPMVLGCYRRMGVLADAGADPATSVRPFSATRRGFAIGEGAGVLVLESPQVAARRGAEPLAFVKGWATGSHTAGLIEVDASGESLGRLIRDALARSRTPPETVDYVHAHGTATPANDLAEARAIRGGLGPAADRVSVSSTKGVHGHLLGAATAVETVLTVLAMRRSLVPPTANLTDPDPGIRLDCTPLRARRRAIRCAVKTASGLGGQMVALVLSPSREPSP